MPESSHEARTTAPSPDGADAAPPPPPRGAARLVPLAVRAMVGLAALAAAIGVYTLLVALRPEVEAADPERTRIQLSAYPVRPVSVRRQWVGYGTARAKVAAEVPARVTSVVVSRPEYVEEGNAVERGQTLVRLDPADIRRELARARQALAEVEAQLAQLDAEAQRVAQRVEIERRDAAIAEREFERIEKLFGRGAASRQDVDARERAWLSSRRALVQAEEAMDRIPARRAALEAAAAGRRASSETAELALDRTNVTTPLAGTIQRVDVEVGESVAPGQRVARVVDDGVIEVALKLPAVAASRIGVGDLVELTEPGVDERVWRSEVVRVAPEQDPEQRTVTVYVEVRQGGASASQRLMPGTFVRGAVSHVDSTPRWVVPRRALRRGRVFVIEDQTIRSREVSPAFEVAEELPATGLPDDLGWLCATGRACSIGVSWWCSALLRSSPTVSGPRRGSSERRWRGRIGVGIGVRGGGAALSPARFGVDKPVPANLLMIALIIGGVAAGLNLRKQFFPESEPDTAC